MGRHRRDYAHSTEDEYLRLVRDAVSVAYHSETPPFATDERCIRTVKTQVEVPVEETVQVPVQKKVAKRQTQQQVVRGKQLVPVRRIKEVEETTVEVQEEVVHGYRWVWKRVKEPTTQVVKKPVAVKKVRQVPYTDYEEREVEMVVNVPCDRVEVEQGYREDKRLSTKMVDVEQDEIYAVRPLYIGKGDTRIREHEGRRDMGCTQVGREVYPGRPLPFESPRTPGLYDVRVRSGSQRSYRDGTSGNPTLSAQAYYDRPASARISRRPASARGVRPGDRDAQPPVVARHSGRSRPHPHNLAAQLQGLQKSVL